MKKKLVTKANLEVVATQREGRQKIIQNFSCWYLYNFYRNNIKLFVTLTGSYKQIKMDFEDKLNESLTKLIRKLKKSYKLNIYLWTGEYGISKQHYHFHLLIDINIKFLELNDIWNNIISNEGSSVHCEIIQDAESINKILLYMFKEPIYFGGCKIFRDKFKSLDWQNISYDMYVYLQSKDVLLTVESKNWYIERKIGTKKEQEILELQMYENTIHKLRNKSIYSLMGLIFKKLESKFDSMIISIFKSKNNKDIELFSKLFNLHFRHKSIKYRYLGYNILYLYIVMASHNIELKLYNYHYRLGSIFFKYSGLYNYSTTFSVPEGVYIIGTLMSSFIEEEYLKDIFDIKKFIKNGIYVISVGIVDNYINELVDSVLINKKLYGKLPMVCEPKDWCFIKNVELSNNFSGGYLGNDIFMKRGLSKLFMSHSIEYKTNKFFLCINKLQKVSYEIDFVLFSFFLKHKHEIFSKMICHDYNDLDNKLLNIKDNLNKKNGNEKELKIEYFRLKSLQGKVELYNRVFAIVEEFNIYKCFYFTYQVDFRGRLYVVSDYLNYQGDKLVRSLLRFNKKKKFDLNWFKIYISSLYFGILDMSGNKLLNKFELINDWTFEKVWVNNLWLNAKEPLLFLSAMLEYDRYRLVGENYESGFIIWLDASCSGSQLISLLFSIDNYADSLNLSPSHYDKNIGDYYLNMVNLFKSLYKEEDWFKQNFLSFSDEKWRKLMKRIIMTLNYGLQESGMLLKFKDELSEMGLTMKTDVLKILCKNFYKFMEENILFKNMELFSELILLLRIGYKKGIIFESGLKGLDPLDIEDIDVKVTQKYYKKLKGRLYFRKFKNNQLKNKGVTFSVLDRNKLDLKKQGIAIKANLIHHIDSLWVFSTLFKSLDLDLNLGVIHDSFGTHSSYVEELNYILKLSLKELFNDKEQIWRFLRSLSMEVAHNSDVIDLKSLTERIEFKKYSYSHVNLLKDIDKAVYLVWPK